MDKDKVERAARAFYECPTPGVDASLRTDWDRLTKASPDVADKYRDGMTAALEAALNPGATITINDAGTGGCTLIASGTPRTTRLVR